MVNRFDHRLTADFSMVKVTTNCLVGFLKAKGLQAWVGTAANRYEPPLTYRLPAVGDNDITLAIGDELLELFGSGICELNYRSCHGMNPDRVRNKGGS